MEWVETTGKTIEDALGQALDQLGVDESDVEFDVLEEPKAGLFGRVRGEARIRARVRPANRGPQERKRGKATAAPGVSASDDSAPTDAKPTAKPAGRAGGRARAASTGTAAPAAEAGSSPKPRTRSSRTVAEAASTDQPAESASVRTSNRDNRAAVDLDEVLASAQGFLTGFFEAASLEVTFSSRKIDDETLEVRVDGQGLGVLVGPKGSTLLALQELVRTPVHHSTGGRSGRLMLDIAGYREKRRAALVTFTGQVAEQVIASGERRALEPMSAVDRKVIHDTVNDIKGVGSISEGEDPDRRVVLIPA